MNRRALLALLGTAATAGASGCAALTDDSPRSAPQTTTTTTQPITDGSPETTTVSSTTGANHTATTTHSDEPETTTKTTRRTETESSVLPLEVTVASTDPLDPDLGFEFRIQRRYSSFLVTEYSTAHLIIQLVNTADRSRRIRLYSRGVFSIPYPNERPTWVLATPREADALWSSDGRTPGCWQFDSTDYGFQRDLTPNSVELAPGASIASAYELWVDPERESCWPTGSVRFESPDDEYVIESDGEETEFSWGFTLDVAPR